MVRLTWPGCGAARREEHLHRPQTRGASLGDFVAGPDRGRARAVWGAFGRAESERRRRGRSRGDQAQKRTTPARSVVRSSASLRLRRQSLGTRAEAQGQLRGPARPWRLFGQPVPRSEEPEAAAGASARAASPPGVAIETGWRAQQKPRVGEAEESLEPRVGSTVERTRNPVFGGRSRAVWGSGGQWEEVEPVGV